MYKEIPQLAEIKPEALFSKTYYFENDNEKGSFGVTSPPNSENMVGLVNKKNEVELKLLNTPSYQQFNNDSYSYFVAYPERMEVLLQILKKLQGNWSNFNKDYMEIRKV